MVGGDPVDDETPSPNVPGSQQAVLQLVSDGINNSQPSGPQAPGAEGFPVIEVPQDAT